MRVSVAGNGKALRKPFERLGQPSTKRFFFQEVADDEQGDRPLVTFHPPEHAFPPGAEGC